MAEIKKELICGLCGQLRSILSFDKFGMCSDCMEVLKIVSSFLKREDRMSIFEEFLPACPFTEEQKRITISSQNSSVRHALVSRMIAKRSEKSWPAFLEEIADQKLQLQNAIDTNEVSDDKVKDDNDNDEVDLENEGGEDWKLSNKLD